MSLGGGETQSPVAGSNKYAEIMELMRRRNAMNNSTYTGGFNPYAVAVPASASTYDQLARLQELRGGGPGGGSDLGRGGFDGYGPNVSPMSNSIKGGFGYQALDTYGNILGGMLPGGFLAQALAQSMNPSQVAKAGVESAQALQDAIAGYTSGGMFGAPPSDASTFAGGGYGISIADGGSGKTSATGAGIAANPMSRDPQQAAQDIANANAAAAAVSDSAIADMAEAEGVALGPAATGDVGGGDSGGPGGVCVDPKTSILLADGSEVPAGSLKVGDFVHTIHEDTFEYGDFEVVYAETIQQPKSIVKFTDGSEITTSLSHKFLLVDREWKRVDELKEGDAIETAPNVNIEGFKVVVSTEQIGSGDVVKLTIDEAHTYISDGLVSHNKFAHGGYVSKNRLFGPNPMGPDDGYSSLKTGEFVMNPKSVGKYGIELMNAINNGKISKGKLRGLLEA